MKSLNFIIKEKSIGWLEWDQPHSSVNLLSHSFIKELSYLLDQIKQAEVSALVLISKKADNFCSGANIKDIQKIKTKKEMNNILSEVHELFLRFEQLNLPKIAVIQGVCMGGGLEWALCFDYRLSSDSSHIQIALPEVKLGLIPGFGGCLRLPRLIGLKASLNMILTGKSLTASEAKKAGLLDEIIPSPVLEKRALEFAQQIAGKNNQIHEKKHYKELRPYSFFIERIFKTFFCLLSKKQILKKTKGFYPAPLKALQVIQKTYGSPISKKNLNREKEAFCELLQSPEAVNLLHVWTMINKAKKEGADTWGNSQKKKSIERIGVVGAGVMGRAIAYTFANKGFKVRLIDKNEQSLCSALKWTGKLFQEQKQKNIINSYKLKQKIHNLSVSTKLWGLSTLDFIVETLPENKKLKQEFIANISKQLNPYCLFASNTSSLSIFDLAQSSQYPENFLGLHFFNPAHKIQLTEIILTEKQKNLYFNPIKHLLKQIGKVPLPVKDSPGFVVNRLLAVYLTEALLIYQEGHEIENIDHCYRDIFGLPLGPFQLMDKIGLDICTEVIAQLISNGLEIETPEWTKELLSVLGQGEKTGKGFYIYDKGKTSLNEDIKKLKQIRRNDLIPNKIIIERGVYRMIKEGKRLIEEKIIESEEDIDLALILSMGFPPFLGGLMNYAKNIGLPQVKKQLQDFENQHGPRFKPNF